MSNTPNEFESNAATQSDGANEKPVITRRRVLAGAGALSTLVASGIAMSAQANEHKHTNSAPKNLNALAAANHCAEQSELCLAHCLVSFQQGETMLAECAQLVYDTMSLCEALASQLTTNSAYVKDLSAVCRKACVDCEAECRKHADHHVECKNCADSCVDLIAAIDKL
jgi:Cys-rich four helix bundle protein (predicted Tat secretion target)